MSVISVLNTGCPTTPGGVVTDDTDTDIIGAGNITVEPCDIDFGDLAAQTIASASVVVNTGDGDLIVEAVNRRLLPFLRPCH